MIFIQYLYAFYMSFIDVFVFSLLKTNYISSSKKIWILPLSMLIYSFEPFIFYKSLAFESMSIMNILWNVMSNIIVTLTGAFVFGEIFSTYQIIGIILSITGMVLLGIH